MTKKFSEIEVGTKFHLVNTVMGGAIPGTPIYVKTVPRNRSGGMVTNANRTDVDLDVRIRDEQQVELI